jgi:hypothetical protein
MECEETKQGAGNQNLHTQMQHESHDFISDLWESRRPVLPFHSEILA